MTSCFQRKSRWRRLTSILRRTRWTSTAISKCLSNLPRSNLLKYKKTTKKWKWKTQCKWAIREWKWTNSRWLPNKMKKTERTQKWISKSYKISKGAYLSSWWEKNSRRRWNKWKALVQCSRTKKRMKLNKLLNRCFKMATSSNSPKEAAFITKFQRRMKTIMIQRWISHRRRNLKGWRGILKKSRRSASQKKVGRSRFSRILWWILQKRIYRKDTRLVLRGVDSSSNMVMEGGLWSIILRLRRTKRCRFGIFCRSSKSKNWAEFRCPCWLMNR